MKVGVVAIQGDFDQHLKALENCSRGVEARPVKTPEQLAEVDRLIIPGGESTTVALLMQRFGLGQAIQDAAKDGMPIWGTCMGMIIMARSIADRPNQWTLALLDITIKRNAFGAQIHSFEEAIPMAGIGPDVTAVFIRAPIVLEAGPDVEILSKYQDQIIAVRQNKLMGTSFHPELTGDARIHEYFLSL